jgi:hypothetical protein
LGLDEKQAELLVQALDLATRLHLGQTNIVGEYLQGCSPRSADPEIVDATLERLRRECFGFSRSESFGITSEKISDDARAMWDIHQVLRHRLSWDRAGNPETRDWDTMMGVNFDEPRRSSHERELPKIETVEEEGGE